MQPAQVVHGEEPPLAVPALGPGIGEVQVEGVDRAGPRCPRMKPSAPSCTMTTLSRPRRFGLLPRLAAALLLDLDADEQRAGPVRRVFGDEMPVAAADLDLDAPRVRVIADDLVEGHRAGFSSLRLATSTFSSRPFSSTPERRCTASAARGRCHLDERVLLEHAHGADLGGGEAEPFLEERGEVAREHAAVAPRAHEELGEPAPLRVPGLARRRAACRPLDAAFPPGAAVSALRAGRLPRPRGRPGGRRGRSRTGCGARPTAAGSRGAGRAARRGSWAFSRNAASCVRRSSGTRLRTSAARRESSAGSSSAMRSTIRSRAPRIISASPGISSVFMVTPMAFLESGEVPRLVRADEDDEPPRAGSARCASARLRQVQPHDAGGVVHVEIVGHGQRHEQGVARARREGRDRAAPSGRSRTGRQALGAQAQVPQAAGPPSLRPCGPRAARASVPPAGPAAAGRAPPPVPRPRARAPRAAALPRPVRPVRLSAVATISGWCARASSSSWPASGGRPRSTVCRRAGALLEHELHVAHEALARLALGERDDERLHRLQAQAAAAQVVDDPARGAGYHGGTRAEPPLLAPGVVRVAHGGERRAPCRGPWRTAPTPGQPGTPRRDPRRAGRRGARRPHPRAQRTVPGSR